MQENFPFEQGTQTESDLLAVTGPIPVAGHHEKKPITDVSDIVELLDSVGVGAESNVSGTVKIDPSTFPDFRIWP